MSADQALAQAMTHEQQARAAAAMKAGWAFRFDPVRLEGGYLSAYDHRYEEVHTFAVHRITGVAALDEDGSEQA